MDWRRWLGFSADDWPPPSSAIGGEFRLAADSFIPPETREPLRLLTEAASRRHLAIHCNVPMELVIRPMGRPRERTERARLLRSLHAPAVLFQTEMLAPRLVILFTKPGFPRGKRPTEDRWRRVLLGTGLPLIRWPLQSDPKAALASDLIDTGLTDPAIHAPYCRHCGAAALRRTAKTGTNAGEPFWGCSEWPTCGWTAPW